VEESLIIGDIDYLRLIFQILCRGSILLIDSAKKSQ